MHGNPFLLALLVLLGWSISVRAVENLNPEPPSQRKAEKINDPRLENAYRLTPKVSTGAQPEGEAAFKALNELGIKTVISVDGATPDVELAHKYGLHYVHLPFGYDGIPPERALEMAKAVKELEGSIYVHCHHGKHRGPAAAATACVLIGALTNAEALADMRVLGTGEHYLGLWASAREARQADEKTLNDLKVDFKEVSPIPKLAEAMVKVDECCERLKECKAAGWKAPQDHPDLDPPHEALILREVYTELMRTPDFAARKDDFKGWMQEAEKAGQELETELQAWKKTGYAGAPPAKLEPALKALQNNCAACHKAYRNAPRDK